MSETRLRRTILGGLCLIVIVLAGYDKTDGAEIDANDATNAPLGSEASKRWKTPSDEECRELAKKLEAAASSGDAAAINSLIDWEALLDRVTGGIDGVDAFRRKFVTGIKKSLGRGNGLAHAVVANVSAGGSYRFLKVRTREGKKSILFRLIGGEESPSVNYHDMLVTSKPRGSIRVVDVYVTTTGEFISSTLRRVFIPLAVAESKSVLQSLNRKESESVKYVDQFGQMYLAMKRKQFRRVLQIYSRLPETLQKDKNILMLQLMAAQKIGDKEYLDALDVYQKYHPADPSLDILVIDAFIIRGEYDKSLAAIDRLDEWVGGDPYLDVLRSNICLLKKDYAKVKKYAKRAIKADEERPDAYSNLVEVSLAERDFRETTRLLTRLENDLDLGYGDLTKDPDFAEYIKSPQYQNWLEWRKGK